MSDNRVCFDRTLVVVLAIILSTLAIYGFYYASTRPMEPMCAPCAPCKPCANNGGETVIKEKVVSPNPAYAPDPIQATDYQKINDVLMEPTRRMPRHELPPWYLAQVTNIPTRGFPDNFNMLGYLTRVKDDTDKANPADLRLPLFGRQTYPGSTQWEYYTTTTDLAINIKIPLNSRTDELVDGDVIFLNEFNGEYRVRLYKLDSPVYNPYVFY